MYVLVRVLAFIAVFAALEVLGSAAWWLLHRDERRTLAELGPRIEDHARRVRADRAWLDERGRLGDSLDAAGDRLGRGVEAYGSRSAYEAARSRHTERITRWNEGLEEQGARGRRADSLVASLDSLVSSWSAVYRRAYPGWFLLPRPAPPAVRQGGA